MDLGHRYRRSEGNGATRYTKMATPYVTDESGKANACSRPLSTTKRSNLIRNYCRDQIDPRYLPQLILNHHILDLNSVGGAEKMLCSELVLVLAKSANT